MCFFYSSEKKYPDNHLWIFYEKEKELFSLFILKMQTCQGNTTVREGKDAVRCVYFITPAGHQWEASICREGENYNRFFKIENEAS